MEWIRRRPTAAAIVGVVSVLAVLALVFLLISPKSDPPETSSIGDLSTLAPATTEAPLPEITPALPTASSTALTAAEVQKATQKTFDQLGKGYSAGGLSSGQLNMQGLQGGSIYQYLPKHKIVLRITSGSPIGTIGYVIPTSLNKSNGTVRNVGTSWTLTTTVYGDPDYAQLFMQADGIGHPITCTITVDGKTTEHRTTEGPYARLICQG